MEINMHKFTRSSARKQSIVQVNFSWQNTGQWQTRWDLKRKDIGEDTVGWCY